ncbi:hypothetical protein MAR_026776 [Mya arenaria]|uniref:Uncharacterized protein n=1 Tax=Mya arenaria TaxID=6604 RepID=A0ABY7EZN0_MYAAR|nr:hypothetical protein MAR_026776 [Mya arenaria]
MTSNVKEIFGEVENQSKVEIDKLRKFRAEINTYLDRREKELLDNIEKVKTEDENALTALKTDCELMKTGLEAMRTELTSGDVSVNQLYVTARRGRKELWGMYNSMKKMVDRVNARKYQFTKDADTERLLGSIMGIGTLDVAGEFRKNISLDHTNDGVAQGTTVKTGTKSKIRYSDGVIRRTNWVGNVLEDTILQIFANGEMDSQVCGRVPPVVFMRDISIARQKQIEELLNNRDTGPPDTELELEEDKLELQVVNTLDILADPCDLWEELAGLAPRGETTGEVSASVISIFDTDLWDLLAISSLPTYILLSASVISIFDSDLRDLFPPSSLSTYIPLSASAISIFDSDLRDLLALSSLPTWMVAALLS